MKKRSIYSVTRSENIDPRNPHTRYPVLLIGYNRPDLIMERAEEILRWETSKIFISVDGPKNSDEQIQTIEIRKRLYKYESDPRVKLIFREKNYGLREHLPTAIDEVLINNEAVVIIEDDIKFSETFYLDLCNSLKKYGQRYMTIGGFSSVPVRIPFLSNRWRETKYFSAWGWGVTRESWSKFDRSIDLDIFEVKLSKSSIWGSLSSTQKDTWSGRFFKITKEKNTWDFQMQYSSFVHEMKHLIPVFRTAENLGFNDFRGTNTRTKRPLLLGPETISRSKFTNKLLPRGFTKILQWLDSVVIAGDRALVHKSLRQINKIVKFFHLKY